MNKSNRVLKHLVRKYLGSGPAPVRRPNNQHLHLVKKLTTAEKTHRVSFSAIARELDIPKSRLYAILKVWGRYLGADRCRTSMSGGNSGITYDAQIIDLLNEILGRPHRCIEPPESDWLADYERERP